MQIEFAWDEKKNAINQKKHDVSFEEAKTCFEDEYARVFFDVEHSAQEDRSILWVVVLFKNTSCCLY